jgi:signal transduction histidine kinase
VQEVVERADAPPARNIARDLAANLLLAVAYAVTGRIGLALAYYQQHATLTWAPAGLAVAAVWLRGGSVLPGVFLGALMVNLSIGSSPPLALAIACGNTAEAWVAWRLVKRAGLEPGLRDVRRLVLFLGLVVFASTSVAAVNGVVWLVALGGLPLARVAPTALIWWLGDAGGVLVATPLLLAFARPPVRMGGRLGAEVVLLALFATLTVATAFGGMVPSTWIRTPIVFLPFPALVWAAVRFGMRGATITCAVVWLAAVGGTVAGTGPFHYGNVHLDVAMLWIFLATLSVSAMLLAASLEERTREAIAREEGERELERSKRLGELGMLAGGIAHDFNNLLAVVRANVEVGRARPEPRVTREVLEAIDEAAGRGAELTNQLLAYAGRKPMQRRDVDLGALAAETARMLSKSLPERVRIDVELPSEPTNVFADPAQLRQVLMNLVLNAAESIDAKAGAIRLRVAHERGPASEALVLLEVEDDGEGMDEETVARVFEPFFTTKPSGRGLGMAAVLGVVRAHGGSIDVESEPSRGTVFRVRFPAAERAAPVLPEARAAEAPTAKSDAARRVLVIDDVPGIRAVARLLLEGAGWSVETAADRVEALDRLAQRGPFDVALVDLEIPGTSGAEIVEDLRTRAPELPVLLMSGYSEDLLEGSRLAGTPFLAKPFREAELLARLEAATTRAA